MHPPKNSKTITPLAVIVVLIAMVLIIFLIREKSGSPQNNSHSSGSSNTPAQKLSRLAEAPDWSALDPWQKSLTRSEFVTHMEQVFTVSPAWKQWFHLDESGVSIDTGMNDQRYHLAFADDPDTPTSENKSPARYWRRTDELGAASPERPLEGLRIAIDPGHIGGRWAKIEARWFQIGDDDPVREGNMTLLVAKKLKPQLEALGADVTLVRQSNEPVTDQRPETFISEAQKSAPDSPQRLAEMLFYRTAEIRARAEKINHEIRPDLVICLHFNAASWGDPNKPTLVEQNHLHLLLNGAYTDEELSFADQRYQLTRRLVERTHKEEKALASSVAESFAEQSGLPPYIYMLASHRAVNIDDNPYLWARNLLANRLYRAPVVFLEPYVMNSKEDYTRIQAGDYPRTQHVAGKFRLSIYQEYANAVTAGLKNHYLNARAIHNP